MPRLWHETIDSHRRAVRDAILDSAADRANATGLRSVTMSQVAQDAGIGRATLYKYFADAEAILTAWHDREISAHLERLNEARESESDPRSQLESVLTAYAVHISQGSHRHHDADLVAFLHADDRVGRARHQVHDLVRELIAEAARAGAVRDDVPPDELAGYCMHSLAAAHQLSSKAAARRLLAVTLAGLQAR